MFCKRATTNTLFLIKYNTMNAHSSEVIEEAKKVLESCGYATSCLWHIRDVKAVYPFLSDDECHQVLEDVLSDEGLTEEHFRLIDDVVDDLFKEGEGMGNHPIGEPTTIEKRDEDDE